MPRDDSDAEEEKSEVEEGGGGKTRRRRNVAAPSKGQRLELRDRPFGIKPVLPMVIDDRSDLDHIVLSEMKSKLGWLCSRAPLRVLEDALGDGNLDVEDTCAHDWTCVHHAAASGALDHLRLIVKTYKRQLEEDSELTLLDAVEGLNGYTALHLAVIGKHPQVVKLLLRAGCDPSLKDKDGETAADMVQAKSRIARILSDKDDSDDDDDDSPRGFQKKKKKHGFKAAMDDGRRSQHAHLTPPDVYYDSRPFALSTYPSCALCDALHEPAVKCTPRHLRNGKDRPAFRTKFVKSGRRVPDFIVI